MNWAKLKAALIESRFYEKLEIYRELNVSTFLISIGVTVKFAVILIPFTVGLSLAVARILQDRGPRFNAITKAICYMPSITSQVAMVIVWAFVFGPTFGLLASIFKALKLTPISWFDNPQLSVPLMAFLILSYTLGQPIILYTAAMGSIPASYFEAAEIDGATRNQVFFKITMPLLHSTTTFVLITTTISMLQVFAVPYLLTNGGPSFRSSTLLLLVYQSAFTYGNFGYASAIGVFLFVVTAAIAALQFRLMKREAIEY
jgi:multiple sugar transport system permease protein